MIYDIIDDLLPKEFNAICENKLMNSHRWHFPPNEIGDDNPHGWENNGLVIRSYPSQDDNLFEINVLGSVILETCIAKHAGTFSNICLERLVWNRYDRKSGCSFHQDSGSGIQSTDVLMSMIYNLNDNDGHNIIGEEKIPSKNGRCILFQSTDWHNAMPPVEYPTRLTLNAVFSYSHYIK